ncbi:BREX-2 system phosphatase PglZ [Knoellia sp. CPCC 206450]|uniref:BREX-2 system phosphatase PglZ n=1 Tax=Knoellia tibetensis TaxID=3404798 RepID=UPI003B42A418
MSPVATATLRTVEHAVQRHWVEGNRPERVLLLSARPEWSGPDNVRVDPVVARVCTARSTLAVRDAMTAHADGLLVVLTDVTNAELGADLLSRAVRQQVLGVDLWDSVRLAFGLKADAILDGGLVREGEVVARALVDRVPVGGWAAPPAGVLTHDHAYRQLVKQVIHLDPSRIDAAGLMDWSREHRGVLALHDLDDPLRHRVTHWLIEKCGAEARPVVELAGRGDGTDAVPLGLAAGLLWQGSSDARAQGRMEERLGRTLSSNEVKDWSELATGWVERRLASDPQEARAVLVRAEELLGSMDATEAAERSALLPRGLTARSRAVAAALAAWVAAPSPRAVTAFESAWTSVMTHHLAGVRTGDSSRQEKDVDCLEMAVRLVRWLGGDVSPPDHALGALAWQIGVGGWVDRARQTVANGASDLGASEGLGTVSGAASKARAVIDREAAKHVAAALRADQDFGSLIPVEDALAWLRHVSSAGRPTLLLVLDGMSAAVAAEIGESVTAMGWVEHAHVNVGRRGGLLAAFPTVTRVSRASLLSGRLVEGEQAQEKRGFVEVLGSAVLFHERELESARGSDLSPVVRDAIQDSSIEVVGAVLNAVDDSLSGGDPARTRWTVDAVRHLRPLLERAAAAGRVVVLTSDHGHVVDQPVEGELRTATGGGSRWRPAPGAGDPGIREEDEVRLTGRRVLKGDGDVVAAVSETLRYRPRHEGYHGGAALAEMSIPWMVMARRGTEVPGHVVIGDQAPTWWHRPRSFEETSRDVSEDGSTLF